MRVDQPHRTGKTTVGLQFLLDGVARGEKGLYVTLSESADELSFAAGTHGWSLDGIEVYELVNELGLDLLPVSSYFQNNSSEDVPNFDQAELLLDDLQKTYDFIIFEMPPLSASLDGLTISSILDSTLLVAEWGRTPMPLLSEATHLLRNANVKIAGVVINKVDGSSPDSELAANYFSYTYTPAATDRRG